MSRTKCWCKHTAETHVAGFCYACRKSRYFETRHAFRPIETLRPLPAFLFRDEAA